MHFNLKWLTFVVYYWLYNTMCYSIVCDKLSLNQNTIFLKTFCRVHVVYYVVYCYKVYNINVRKLYPPISNLSSVVESRIQIDIGEFFHMSLLNFMSEQKNHSIILQEYGLFCYPEHFTLQARPLFINSVSHRKYISGPLHLIGSHLCC